MPDINDLKSNTKNIYYNSREIRRYETICLILLKHKLNYYTVYNVIEIFLQSGIVYEDEVTQLPPEIIKEKVESMYKFIFQLLDKIAVNKIYLSYHPLVLASTIIALCRENFNFVEMWSSKFEYLYDIELADFEVCYREIKRYLLYFTVFIVF